MCILILMCIDDKRSPGYRTCKWTWMQKRMHIIEGTMYMCSYIYVHMGKKTRMNYTYVYTYACVSWNVCANEIRSHILSLSSYAYVKLHTPTHVNMYVSLYVYISIYSTDISNNRLEYTKCYLYLFMYMHAYIKV